MQNVSVYTDATTNNMVTKIPTKLNEFVSMIIDKIGEFLKAPSMADIQRIDWSDISAILGTISIILILTIIFVIGLYIIKAIGLYTMSRKEGSKFAWLAFVPFGCLFTYGFITGKTKIFGIDIEHSYLLLPSLLLSTCLPYIGGMATILFVLAYFAMLYRIYESRTPNFAIVLLILSILVPIVSPIVLFAIREK